MHDSKGREIAEGDILAIKAWPTGHKNTAGKVIGIATGSDTCNCAVVGFDHATVMTVTAKETTLILKQNGEIVSN